MDESRLGRDQFQTGHALWQIIDAGVRVFYYLPDREVKLDNATSGFLEQVKLFAAQIERENTAHRTRDAMVRKAQAGHVTGGIVFGYDNVPQLGPDGKRSHTDRQVNADEAAVVVRIFEMARDGLGLVRIAKALNGDMAPAPKPGTHSAGRRGVRLRSGKSCAAGSMSAKWSGTAGARTPSRSPSPS